MLVTLPSGLTADLETPNVRLVLTYGGSVSELSAAVMLGDVSHTLDDLYCVASWAVAHLADDPEALALASVCELYGEAPSQRLRITDPVLAYECDLSLATAREKAAKSSKDQTTDEADTAVKFSVVEEGDESYA